MGTKITRLSPQQGFCAETGGAIAGWFITMPAAAFTGALFHALAPIADRTLG